MENKKFVASDNENINYMGRIDFENKKKPALIYAGSNLRFKFTGNSLSIAIDNISFKQDIWLGYFLDGKQYTLKICEKDDSIKCEPEKEPRFETTENMIFDIPVENNNDVHTFILYKKMDGTHIFRFNGFYLDKESDIVSQPALPKRKLEFYGDSVCCGAVCQAVDHIGVCDPEGHEGKYDDSWYSFAMITSRLLNAQINNVSQGGMAVLDGTGYCFAPYFPGLESTYTKLQYISYYDKKEWDFSDYTPDVVVIALGQNDNHTDGMPDNDITQISYRVKWKDAYKKILSDLHKKYPKASFILTTTVLRHDVQWDKAIDELISELGSDRVYRNYFRRNGDATDGHPRISEQEEMAVELTEFINSLGEEIWAE